MSLKLFFSRPLSFFKFLAHNLFQDDLRDPTALLIFQIASRDADPDEALTSFIARVIYCPNCGDQR